ncbi:hypothetical protein ACO9S2_09440 [Nitrospira sp. NS4]|uniref:hypothetical protein n=1 Tax=Nitrospira sp. NS4 TaxID=3414498 RepID=UPI003C2ACBE5
MADSVLMRIGLNIVRATRINIIVYFVLEPEAAQEVIEVANKIGAAVWVGLDAMTHEEHYRIASEGVNLTRFEYPLSGADEETIQDALEMVKLHHPGESVWVQYVSAA